MVVFNSSHTSAHVFDLHTICNTANKTSVNHFVHAYLITSVFFSMYEPLTVNVFEFFTSLQFSFVFLFWAAIITSWNTCTATFLIDSCLKFYYSSGLGFRVCKSHVGSVLVFKAQRSRSYFNGSIDYLWPKLDHTVSNYTKVF